MAKTRTLLSTLTVGVLLASQISCSEPPATETAVDPHAGHNHSLGAESEDGFAAFALSEVELEAVGIVTVQASRQSLSSELSAMGRVLAHQHRTAIVSYPFTARVSEISARVGDWVEAGQELVILQSEEVGEATSAFYRANADYELAQLDHERETQLFENGVGARKNSLATEAALRVAEANRDAAEKKLHVLGFTEEEITVLNESHQVNPVVSLYSPIAGKVITNDVVLGEMVDESTEILTIMDPRVLWVDAEIFEMDIARIQTGQGVAITVPAYPDQVFNGRITYISDVLNEDTRTITVRTEVSNSNSRLKPGMFANVVIDLGTNGGALAVPTTAVLDDQGDRLVFIRTSENEFEPRHVTTGTREGNLVEIASGVELGEEVVTNGNFQLKSKLYEALLEAGHVH